MFIESVMPSNHLILCHLLLLPPELLLSGPIFCQLIRKDHDAGKDGRQEEKGMTEDEMIGWHH